MVNAVEFCAKRRRIGKMQRYGNRKVEDTGMPEKKADTGKMGSGDALTKHIQELLRKYDEQRTDTSAGLLKKKTTALDALFSDLIEVETKPKKAAPWSVLSLLTEDIEINKRVQQLESEIAGRTKELEEKTKALLSEKQRNKQWEEEFAKLKAEYDEINLKKKISHLVDRVGAEARSRLLSDPKFQDVFASETTTDAFVVSIDIRRSTELMLKAKEPKLYAKFVLQVARALQDVIVSSFGVFDKFTGDGVLGFYPMKFSGDDFGMMAVEAALSCHREFAKIYRQHRSSFVSVLADIGLGVGIDYGSVQMVNIGGDFTVVGTPVVYACRMSGCQSGETTLNFPAYEMLLNKYSAFLDFEEKDVEIKREGRTLAYTVKRNEKAFASKRPAWCGDARA